MLGYRLAKMEAMSTRRKIASFAEATPFFRANQAARRSRLCVSSGRLQTYWKHKNSSTKLPNMSATQACAAQNGATHIRMYVINAFTAPTLPNLRTGNPAAVALLSDMQDRQLSDEARQELAAEMNLSETAFVTRVSGEDSQNRFRIRWFTPAVEVDLCGHATLAAARAVIEEGWATGADMRFETTRKGTLGVRADKEEVEMEFPGLEARYEMSEAEKGLVREALGVEVVECFRSDYDVVARVRDSRTVEEMVVSVEKLREVETRGMIVTAKGADGVGFVSRFFAPRVGIGEDAVTGSAHCVLAQMFIDSGEMNVEARQVSRRGGWLRIGRPRKGVVSIAGRTRVVWNGTLFL